MSGEFLPALVVAVQRAKEGDRIGHVDQAGYFQFAAPGEEGRDALVVGHDQPTVFVADAQAQSFVNLQPVRPFAHGRFERIR